MTEGCSWECYTRKADFAASPVHLKTYIKSKQNFRRPELNLKPQYIWWLLQVTLIDWFCFPKLWKESEIIIFLSLNLGCWTIHKSFFALVVLFFSKQAVLGSCPKWINISWSGWWKSWGGFLWWLARPFPVFPVSLDLGVIIVGRISWSNLWLVVSPMILYTLYKHGNNSWLESPVTSNSTRRNVGADELMPPAVWIMAPVS